ncbi:hypothetical protein THAOC_17951, partial [Thalassiosira oceanica]
NEQTNLASEHQTQSTAVKMEQMVPITLTSPLSGFVLSLLTRDGPTMGPPLEDPSNDYADFYYSSDVDPPNWTSLGTKRLAVGEVDPDGFGSFESVSFNIAEGIQSIHAIRVDFRNQGSPSDTACTGGSWADTDDLAFYVVPND